MDVVEDELDDSVPEDDTVVSTAALVKHLLKIDVSGALPTGQYTAPMDTVDMAEDSVGDGLTSVSLTESAMNFDLDGNILEPEDEGEGTVRAAKRTKMN